MIPSPPGDLAFYLIAIPAVILIGLDKGGFVGLSSLAMPLLAVAVSPVKAAAIVLPILIVQDWVGVWAYRHDFDRRNLLILTPAAAVGVAFGWAMAARVDEQAVRLVIGVISVGFVGFMLLRSRIGRGAPMRARVAPGLFWGAIAGFTSFINHVGAPPVMAYMLPQKLKPRVFAGTAAVFFAIVNLLKLWPYFALGQFSRNNLGASAALLPVAVLAILTGVWLVRRVSAERFHVAVLSLTFIIGVKLIWDGAWGLWG
jgi:uncharacterized protein